MEHYIATKNVLSLVRAIYRDVSMTHCKMKQILKVWGRGSNECNMISTL